MEHALLVRSFTIETMMTLLSASKMSAWTIKLKVRMECAMNVRLIASQIKKVRTASLIYVGTIRKRNWMVHAQIVSTQGRLRIKSLASLLLAPKTIS